MNCEDLTKEEIAVLPLEMRCCYFLWPWNSSMNAPTVEGWAHTIGFYAYHSDDTTYIQSVNTAKHKANELIRFVVGMRESHESMVVGNLRSINVRLHRTIDERDNHITELEKQIAVLDTKFAEYHNKFVGTGDDSHITLMRRHIKELEELHDIDTEAWKKRECELLQMVTDRDQDIDTIRHDCELLDVMLEIANPIIKSGEYSYAPSESLSRAMRKMCRDMIALRGKHGIVG